MAVQVQVVNGIPTPVITTSKEEPNQVVGGPPANVWEDLDEALEELNDATPDYQKAQTYYEGTAKEKFVNAAIAQLLSGSESDFKVNLAGRVVDAVLDRMEIAAVTAEPVEDPDAEDDTDEGGVGQETAEAEEMTEEERLLDEAISKIWRDNEMDIEAPEIHQKMLAFGDSYLFVGENDEGDRIDLFYNSPLSVRILYQDENPRKKRLAIKRWEVGPKNNKRVRINLYYEDGTWKFITKGNSDKAGAGSFEVYHDDSTDENGYLPNESKEIPFFHFRTARPYGKPEHLKAYGPQDALTKLITNMMSTSDFAAFPQRWALQENGTSTDDDLDWNTEGADEKNPNDLQSQLVSGPGRLWPLRNIKAVGQFDAADVEQFLKPINTFTGLMAAVTATPVSYFLVALGTAATPVSGESQRKGESPFLSKVNNRQLSAEASWQDALDYGLRLKGLHAEVKVRWAPSQVVSGEAGWKAVQEQQKAGVPVRQTLLEAGYTEAEVTSWGYTEESPDGSGGIEGVDLSSVPLPGQPMPGAPLPEVAPTPPAQASAQPAAV